MSTVGQTARSFAGVNFALVKYWGKRPGQTENLPAVGSLSLTLAALGTETSVCFDPALTAHQICLAGEPWADLRMGALLNEVRALAGVSAFARVETHNTVPTAAGLASSASGMAALAHAAWRAAGLPETALFTDPAFLGLVRRGSGSALRSLYGGFVLLDRETATPTPLSSPLDVRVVVAVVAGAGPKAVDSRTGMTHTALTSPYYPAWVDSHPADLAEGAEAVQAGALSRLGEVMERSTLKMHACMLASSPGLRYLKPTTLAVMDVVEGLRQQGVSAWYTMDAGPHVKVLCATPDAPRVEAALAAVPGLARVLIARPGIGVASLAP